MKTLKITVTYDENSLESMEKAMDTLEDAAREIENEINETFAFEDAEDDYPNDTEYEYLDDPCAGCDCNCETCECNEEDEEPSFKEIVKYCVTDLIETLEDIQDELDGENWDEPYTKDDTELIDQLIEDFKKEDFLEDCVNVLKEGNLSTAEDIKGAMLNSVKDSLSICIDSFKYLYLLIGSENTIEYTKKFLDKLNKIK